MASIRLNNNGTLRDIPLTGTATTGSRIIVGGTGTELTTDISKTDGSPLLKVGTDKYIREKYINIVFEGFLTVGTGILSITTYYGWHTNTAGYSTPTFGSCSVVTNTLGISGIYSSNWSPNVGVTLSSGPFNLSGYRLSLNGGTSWINTSYDPNLGTLFNVAWGVNTVGQYYHVVIATI